MNANWNVIARGYWLSVMDSRRPRPVLIVPSKVAMTSEILKEVSYNRVRENVGFLFVDLDKTRNHKHHK